MRNSTAFFAGVVTVFSATALGFGGAMMLTTATTSHSTTEAAKLERGVASPAKASPSADPKTVTAASAPAATQESNRAPAAPSSPPLLAQQAATLSPSAKTSPAAQTKSETSAQPPGAEQSTASSQAKSAANAYAQSNDADIRKYVSKRERHWARRHYHDDDATSARQDARSDGQSDRSQPSISVNQPAAQEQSQGAQIKTADQTATTKIEDSDTGKIKRKHDRRWTRGYSRDYGERGRDEDRAPSFEVREMPREDGPQTPFGSPRWRPFFSDSDDDD